MNERVPVSCFIRTLNEERRIGQVIASVRDLVSEIWIVDSGSTDATAAIAEAEGARVVHQPWLGSGRQKRAGEDLCSNDFLFDLDADEVVSPELAGEIRTLFAAGPPPCSIYELKLVTVPPVGEPWWNAAVDYRRKLYDRRVVRAPDHKGWDQFLVPKDAKVGRLSGLLLHHSFTSLGHLMEKLNRVSTVRARESRRKGIVSVSLRILFALPFYFLKHWLLRGLFRVGLYGVAVAGVSAYGRWLRDVKMYELILMERKQANPDKQRTG